MPQNFLAGSACNVGALDLEQCSLELYKAAVNASALPRDPSHFESIVPLYLIEQVRANNFSLGQPAVQTTLSERCWERAAIAHPK